MLCRDEEMLSTRLKQHLPRSVKTCQCLVYCRFSVFNPHDLILRVSERVSETENLSSCEEKGDL